MYYFSGVVEIVSDLGINFAFSGLTLKAPITTAAEDIHNFFPLFFREIRLDVSSESSEKAGFSFLER